MSLQFLRLAVFGLRGLRLGWLPVCWDTIPPVVLVVRVVFRLAAVPHFCVTRVVEHSSVVITMQVGVPKAFRVILPRLDIFASADQALQIDDCVAS